MCRLPDSHAGALAGRTSLHRPPLRANHVVAGGEQDDRQRALPCAWCVSRSQDVEARATYFRAGPDNKRELLVDNCQREANQSAQSGGTGERFSTSGRGASREAATNRAAGRGLAGQRRRRRPQQVPRVVPCFRREGSGSTSSSARVSQQHGRAAREQERDVRSRVKKGALRGAFRRAACSRRRRARGRGSSVARRGADEPSLSPADRPTGPAHQQHPLACPPSLSLVRPPPCGPPPPRPTRPSPLAAARFRLRPPSPSASRKRLQLPCAATPPGSTRLTLAARRCPLPPPIAIPGCPRQDTVVQTPQRMDFAGESSYQPTPSSSAAGGDDHDDHDRWDGSAPQELTKSRSHKVGFPCRASPAGCWPSWHGLCCWPWVSCASSWLTPCRCALPARLQSQVSGACAPCKRAHLACEPSRPCKRCISMSREDQCIDLPVRCLGLCSPVPCCGRAGLTVAFASPASVVLRARSSKRSAAGRSCRPRPPAPRRSGSLARRRSSSSSPHTGPTRAAR